MDSEKEGSNNYTGIYVGEGYKAVVYSGINYIGKEKLFSTSASELV